MLLCLLVQVEATQSPDVVFVGAGGSNTRP